VRSVRTPVGTYAAKKKELAEKVLAVTNLTERSATLPAGDAAVIGYELTIRRLGSEIETLRVDCDNARRAAEKHERVEQSVGEWKDCLATAQDNVELLGDLNTLSRPEIRAMHRRWLEALGARVIVQPIGSDQDLATLQLHLNQLDLDTVGELESGPASPVVWELFVLRFQRKSLVAASSPTVSN
jgi:hypothetical protein